MYKLEVDSATGKARRVTVQFKNLYALVTASINIVNAFRQLHRAGKSYQDLNDGAFFINVANGDVLVCDCKAILLLVKQAVDCKLNIARHNL
jgi:hypothetical protein